MSTYIAFLRGVNVGGHTIKKEEFLEVFSSLGFKNVRTFISSGNVLFESDNTDEKALEVMIENALKTRFGYEVRTMLRKDSEIKKMIEKKPFGDREENDSQKLYLFLQSDKLDSSLTLPIKSEKDGYEVVRADDRELYYVTYQLPNGRYGDHLAIGKLFGKKIAVTSRNWNTIIRIHSLLDK